MSLSRMVAGPVGAMVVMAALLPTAAVVGARLAWPVEGPTAARAASPASAPSEPVVWQRQEWSAAQNEAQAKATAALAAAVGPTPFPPPTPLATKVGRPVEPQTPLARRAADFSLTSILNGQQPVAIVNGKVCRVGGKIVSKSGDTWVVTAIDASGGTVEVENAAVGTLELRLPSAGDH
jgi:hypothetical protein